MALAVSLQRAKLICNSISNRHEYDLLLQLHLSALLQLLQLLHSTNIHHEK